MPVSYQFKDRATNEVVPLNDVDRKLCEHTNYPYNEKTYHPMYDVIVMTGIGILIMSSETVVDRKDFDIYKTRHEGLDYELIEKFLLTDYEFHAWR